VAIASEGKKTRGPKRDPQGQLLDAAERLLEREGAVGITTRKVANEAQINPALVHYYFESVEELCAKVIERVSDDLIERQRRIFHSEMSLSVQWRQATEPLRSNIGRRRMKVWFELSAMAVNRPVLLRKMVEVNAAWRKVIRDAIERERVSRGIDVAGFSDDALAALMSVVLKGLYWENLQEFHEGHDELMAAADRMLSALDDSLAPPKRRVAT
jgi:AcrR family transcriptional regulator